MHQGHLFNTLYHHFKSEKLKAISTLTIYFDNVVAVGDHSKIIDDMTELVKQAADADSAIEILKKEFAKHDNGDF